MIKITIPQDELIKIMSKYADDAPKAVGALNSFIKEIAEKTSTNHGKDILLLCKTISK